jgi:hypothetical protein
VSQLLAQCAKDESEDPQNIIQSFMADMADSQGWDLPAQLAMLVNVFDTMSDMEDRFVRTVNAAWSYIIDTTLWQESFQTLADFKYTVDYQHKVLPSIVRHQEITRRAVLVCNDVTSTWGMNPMTDWPDDIQPPVISNHMARELRRLSQLATYSVVLPRIRSQITKRRSMFRTKNTPRILRIDLEHVRTALELELESDHESPLKGPGQSNKPPVIHIDSSESSVSSPEISPAPGQRPPPSFDLELTHGREESPPLVQCPLTPPPDN